jgi:hypothetical protein
MIMPRPASPRALALTLFICWAGAGCELPPAPAPLLGPTPLPGKNLTLLAIDHRSLALVDSHDGTKLWRYTPPKTVPPRYGTRPEPYLSCRPALAPNGQIVVFYTDGIVALLEQSGAERWTHVYRTRSEWTSCPVVLPDSGVVFVDPQKSRGKTLLVKLDRDGQLAWQSVLPDVGLAETSPQVDRASGDVIVQTPSHVVSVNPTGKVNWIRERSRYASE